MKKSKFGAKYQHEYRRKQARAKYWVKCEGCGSTGPLFVLSHKDKSTMTPLEIKKTPVCCPTCLFKSQPLLSIGPPGSAP